MMPVTLELAKKHCRVDGDYEDDLIKSYIEAAAGWVEKYTGHLLTERPVTLKFPRFGSELRLAIAPIKSVDSVTYLDGDGAEQTLTGARLYQGALLPQANTSWPATLSKSDVEVTVTAGYAEGDVPAELKQAVMLLTSHQYENREAVVVGTIAAEMPAGVVALAHPFRVVLR